MAFKTIIGPEGAREITAPLKSSFARKPGFDYDRVIDIAFQDLQEKFHLKNMNIFLLDSNDEKLIGYRLFNPEIPEEINNQIYQMPVVLAEEPGVVKYILQERVAVFVPELQLDMITSPWGRQIFLMTGMKSNLMLPLVIDDVVCGLITFPSYREPLKISREQIEEIERRVLYISIALNSMFYAIELKEKNQIIEDKSRLQREFMANMSHEIRTPMNAIIGFSGLALNTDLTPKQADYLLKIESSAKSLLGIINDILDFSKIEAGKLSIEHLPFRLDAVFENVADIISTKAEEKGLRLVVSIDPDVPRALTGDPLRLGQILINLAGNAVKFTPQGRVSMRAELLHQTASECTIKFLISDTGIGMTPEQIAKLFTAFSQADTSVTRKYGGTGLGLSISKNLIELMGGQIRLDSIAGKGSTFSFTLGFPLQSTEAAARIAPAHVSPAAPIDLSRIAGAKILLVEDNPLNQHLAIEILSDAGLRIEVAHNGVEAIEALERSHFDLVLMDSQMPVMGGFEATRNIRLNPRLHGLPIIAMTAHAMQGYREECLAVGMNDYLSKPIDTDHLFALLTKWITPARDTSAALRPASSIPAPAAMVLPAEMKGLDIADGLARMRGKHQLYKKLLKSFVRDYASTVDNLQALIAANKLDDAARVAHSLKGVSGTLSATGVQDAADQLEKSLRQQHVPEYAPRLARLNDEMAVVLDSVRGLPDD